jgi:hypothetical protein
MPSKPRLVDLRGGRKIPPPSSGDIRAPQARRSALKTRRRRLRAIISASICVTILLTAYAVHYASYTERFTFSTILLQGNSIDEMEIKEFIESKIREQSTGYISGANILTFDYAQLVPEIVNNFPSIKNAEVTQESILSNALSVTLIPRTAYARWCVPENTTSCFVIDDEGIVYSPVANLATTSIHSQYIFTGELSTTTISIKNPPLGESFAGGHFKGIKTLLELLHDLGYSPLGAGMRTGSDFDIRLKEGFYLKITSGQDPQVLAKNLALILNSDAIVEKQDQLEYVDLRFGNRVYYKFKNEANETD